MRVIFCLILLTCVSISFANDKKISSVFSDMEKNMEQMQKNMKEEPNKDFLQAFENMEKLVYEMRTQIDKKRNSKELNDVNKSMQDIQKMMRDALGLKRRGSQSYSSVFEEMEREMEEMRNRMREAFSGAHMHSFDNSLSGMTDLDVEEDEKYVYYKIRVQKLDKRNVKIKIEKGMINIEGKVVTVKKSKDSQGNESHSKHVSRFKKSYDLPDDVDPAKAIIEMKNDLIIVKLPKVSDPSKKKKSSYDVTI